MTERALGIPHCVGRTPLLTQAISMKEPALAADGWSRLAGCALLLAAVGPGASDSEAVRKHAEKDRGAAAAERVHPERVHRERVAKQKREQLERSEVIQRGQVSAARQVGDKKQTKASQRNCPTRREATHRTLATVTRD